MSNAWSHGTSSSTMVSVPFTSGSKTTFKPLISWIRRKKSFKSTSFRFTEIGSPVYFGALTVGGCAFCSAAMFTAGWIAGADVWGGVWLVAGAEDCVEACIARFAAGNRLPSGLSTNFEAASSARAGALTGATSFLGAYEGSTNTKLLAAVLSAATGLAGVVSAAVFTGTLVFAGAAVCATAAADSSFSVSF